MSAVVPHCSICDIESCSLSHGCPLRSRLIQFSWFYSLVERLCNPSVTYCQSQCRSPSRTFTVGPRQRQDCVKMNEIAVPSPSARRHQLSSSHSRTWNNYSKIGYVYPEIIFLFLWKRVRAGFRLWNQTQLYDPELTKLRVACSIFCKKSVRIQVIIHLLLTMFCTIDAKSSLEKKPDYFPKIHCSSQRITYFPWKRSSGITSEKSYIQLL